MTLDAWRRRTTGFSTTLVPATGQTWNVYFRTPDERCSATVDLERDKVTQITVEK